MKQEMRGERAQSGGDRLCTHKGGADWGKYKWKSEFIGVCGVGTERGVELYIHEHTDISIMWGQRKDKKKKKKKSRLVKRTKDGKHLCLIYNVNKGIHPAWMFSNFVAFIHEIIIINENINIIWLFPQDFAKLLTIIIKYIVSSI